MYTIGPRLLCLLIVLATTDVAAAQTSFTISGTIKDATGAAIPNVMLVLLSDVNGTQIVFTDQSGNYIFTHCESKALKLPFSSADNSELHAKNAEGVG